MPFPLSRIVCLSVCLSACPLAYLKNYTKFSVHVTCASSADDRVMRCVLPVLWTTSHFQIMEGIDRIKDDAVSSSSPGDGINRTSGNVSWLRSRGGGTGGEVCRLWLHLVADCIPALSALSVFFRFCWLGVLFLSVQRWPALVCLQWQPAICTAIISVSVSGVILHNNLAPQAGGSARDVNNYVRCVTRRHGWLG